MITRSFRYKMSARERIRVFIMFMKIMSERERNGDQNNEPQLKGMIKANEKMKHLKMGERIIRKKEKRLIVNNNKAITARKKINIERRTNTKKPGKKNSKSERENRNKN